MKRLFETADLEAELFEMDGNPEGNMEYLEIDLGNIPEDAESMMGNYSMEDLEEFPALELTLELADGRTLEYELAAVFVHKEKEYVGLHPKTDTEGLIHIMHLMQGEDDAIVLNQIEDEEELNEAFNVFLGLFAEESASYEDTNNENE